MNPVTICVLNRLFLIQKIRNSKVLRNMAQMDTRLNIDVIEEWDSAVTV